MWAGMSGPHEEECRMKQFLKLKGLDERSVMLIVGIAAVVLAGLLIAVGRYLGIYFSKPMVEITLFSLLMVCFPEPPGRSWRVLSAILFVVIGIVLGLIWVVLFAFPVMGNTEFRSLADFAFLPLLSGLSASLITAPLFEEKVARHLLLRGLGVMHPFLASLLVSCVFALVHVNSVVWAFCASMVLCFTAVRLRMTSAQRAVSHGVCNLLITAWYYTDAYGMRLG